MFADPPSKSRGTSGEVRLTHTITEGPRLHALHFSLRGRAVTARISAARTRSTSASPRCSRMSIPPGRFQFGEQSRDSLRQWIYGIAYDGRWKRRWRAQLRHFEDRVPQVDPRSGPHPRRARLAAALQRHADLSSRCTASPSTAAIRAASRKMALRRQSRQPKRRIAGDHYPSGGWRRSHRAHPKVEGDRRTVRSQPALFRLRPSQPLCADRSDAQPTAPNFPFRAT